MTLANCSIYGPPRQWSQMAVLAAAVYLILSGSAHADDSSDNPTKSKELSPSEKTAAKLKYNLFEPTPDDQLRPFTTDRPSKTDSPVTVDAGRFQLEADFANFTYDRYNALGTNTRVETLLVAPTYLKVGLFENVDFQMLVPTYEWIQTDERDVPATVSSPTSNLGPAAGARPRREVTTVDGYGDMLFSTEDQSDRR